MEGDSRSPALPASYKNVTSEEPRSTIVPGSPAVPSATIEIWNLDLEIPDLSEEGARMDPEELRGLLPVSVGSAQSIGNMADFHVSQRGPLGGEGGPQSGRPFG